MTIWNIQCFTVPMQMLLAKDAALSPRLVTDYDNFVNLITFSLSLSKLPKLGNFYLHPSRFTVKKIDLVMFYYKQKYRVDFYACKTAKVTRLTSERKK